MYIHIHIYSIFFVIPMASFHQIRQALLAHQEESAACLEFGFLTRSAGALRKDLGPTDAMIR